MIPVEIIGLILDYLPPSTSLLLVSWDFYQILIPRVYARIRLIRHTQFVRSIEDDPGLAEYITFLDLSSAERFKHSTLSRLIRRAKNLESIIAPSWGWSTGCARHLRRRTLTHVDLSAINEVVTIGAINLIIPSLQSFKFPRFTSGDEVLHFGDAMRDLVISGNILDTQLVSIPPVTALSFWHCPKLSTAKIQSILTIVGPGLKVLGVYYPMSISNDALNHVLVQCPLLSTLRTNIEYLTKGALLHPHPLRSLELNSSGSLLRDENKISADDVLEAALTMLPDLRKVSWSIQVGWRRESRSVKDLSDVMEDNGGQVRCL